MKTKYMYVYIYIYIYIYICLFCLCVGGCVDAYVFLHRRNNNNQNNSKHLETSSMHILNRANNAFPMDFVSLFMWLHNYFMLLMWLHNYFMLLSLWFTGATKVSPYVLCPSAWVVKKSLWPLPVSWGITKQGIKTAES